MTYCAACIVKRKATRIWILRDEPGHPKSVLDLCPEHWQMAKAMGVRFLIHANPALEAKIKEAKS